MARAGAREGPRGGRACRGGLHTCVRRGRRRGASSNRGLRGCRREPCPRPRARRPGRRSPARDRGSRASPSAGTYRAGSRDARDARRSPGRVCRVTSAGRLGDAGSRAAAASRGVTPPRLGAARADRLPPLRARRRHADAARRRLPLRRSGEPWLGGPGRPGRPRRRRLARSAARRARSSIPVRAAAGVARRGRRRDRGRLCDARGGDDPLRLDPLMGCVAPRRRHCVGGRRDRARVVVPTARGARPRRGGGGAGPRRARRRHHRARPGLRARRPRCDDRRGVAAALLAGRRGRYDRAAAGGVARRRQPARGLGRGRRLGGGLARAARGCSGLAGERRRRRPRFVRRDDGPARCRRRIRSGPGAPTRWPRRGRRSCRHCGRLRSRGDRLRSAVAGSRLGGRRRGAASRCRRDGRPALRPFAEHRFGRPGGRARRARPAPGVPAVRAERPRIPRARDRSRGSRRARGRAGAGGRPALGGGRAVLARGSCSGGRAPSARAAWRHPVVRYRGGARAAVGRPRSLAGLGPGRARRRRHRARCRRVGGGSCRGAC